ncbi:MAG: hypothetical protein O9972_19165 [Burkholderiales bacterium]|nr:hypothetical protein [Burkholderiales bacterium]
MARGTVRATGGVAVPPARRDDATARRAGWLARAGHTAAQGKARIRWAATKCADLGSLPSSRQPSRGGVRRGNGSPRSAGRLIAVRGAGGAAVEARNVQREGLDPPRTRVARGRREHRARNPGVPEAGQAEAAPVGAGADRPVGADDTAPRPRSVPHAWARMRRRRARRVAHQRDNLVPVLQRQHDDQSAG